MARIFYSLSGEGRGHATRVMTVVEMFREEHEITVFTYGDAYDMLSPLYRGSDVTVRRIPGLRFKYDGLTLDYARTGYCVGNYYLKTLRPLVDELAGHIRSGRADLVITDFEPALPRAAARCGVPFVSLDHQHFLVVSDLSELPAGLRWWADTIGLAVRACCRGQARTIVSSFYGPPLKRAYRQIAVQVGPLLRRRVLDARPERRGHAVAYLRRSASPGLLSALADSGIPVRVYGLGERPASGDATFHPVTAEGFLEDLATSQALICTAGNQIVGEALHLGKPVLAIPEPGNREQHINAHFVRRRGVGNWLSMDAVTSARLQGFMDRLEDFKRAMRPGDTAGNAAVRDALSPFLS